MRGEKVTMVFFDRFKTKNTGFTVASPVSGRVVPLEEVPDTCFSAGIVGPGCAVWPEEGVLRAPFCGRVTLLPDTLHALGLCSENGIEVLLHIGLDTVDMEGKGFIAEVKEGQSFKQGDLLLRFDQDAIEQAGHPAITLVVVTNSDAFPRVELLEKGIVESGKPILRVAK